MEMGSVNEKLSERRLFDQMKVSNHQERTSRHISRPSTIKKKYISDAMARLNFRMIQKF